MESHDSPSPIANGHLNGHQNSYQNGHTNGHNGHHSLKSYPPPVMMPPSPQETEEEWDLRQILAMLRRRAWVIAGVAVSVLSVVTVSTLRQTPAYESGFRLLVEPVTSGNNLSDLTTLNENGAKAGTGLDYQTQIQVLQSPEILARTVREIRSQYPELTYGTLVKNLIISRVPDTKILEVRYRDSDPEKVQAVLQQLARDYLRYSLEERQTNLRQGIHFVEEQLPFLQSRVDQIQQDIQLFRQQYSFIDPENQAQQISNRILSLAQKRQEVDQQLVEAHSHINILSSPEGAVAALNSAPHYQSLVGQLRGTEVTLSQEATRFSSQNPAMEVLEEQRQNLFPILKQEAQRVLQSELSSASANVATLQVRSQAIAQAEQQLNQQVLQLPVLARQYADLQRELKVATDSLSRFLATRETLQIEAAQTEIPWQLLAAPALPQVPVSPNIKRGLLLGMVAGLLLGLAIALLLEKLDEVFHSIEEVKDKTKLPLLGTIPYQKQLANRQAHPWLPQFVPTRTRAEATRDRGYRSNYYGSSTFLEAFRSLYANVRLLGSDTPIRSVVISSAQPADGKSTVTTYLAQAAAAMGQRVLLVDADLRRPQVQEHLGLPNLRGLSNLIATELAWQEVVQPVPDHENLFAITAGQIPPDPTKLLSSCKMQDLMGQMNQAFDLVIYDTPPLLGLADANLLAIHTDGVMLVVGLGKTDRSDLLQVIDHLKMSPVSVLGTIANGLRRYTAGNYNYYYRRYRQPNPEDITATL